MARNTHAKVLQPDNEKPPAPTFEDVTCEEQVIAEYFAFLAVVTEYEQKTTGDSGIFNLTCRPAIDVAGYMDRIRCYILPFSSLRILPLAHNIMLRAVSSEAGKAYGLGAGMYSGNIHKLIAASVTVAHKYLEDRALQQEHMCLALGIGNEELMQLELAALTCIDFRLAALDSSD